MRPVVIFPDAVEVIIGHLADVLDDPVEPRVPNPRPDRFLTVQRVGGARRTIVTDAPLLAFEAWAQSDQDAHDLAQLARAHVHALVGTAVYLVEEAGGPALLPDPESHQSRYVFTVAVHLRGEAA